MLPPIADVTLRACARAACALGLASARTAHLASACVIITSWMLATGRTLPAGVAPQSLSEDELISFWADDHTANESDAISGPDPAADAR